MTMISLNDNFKKRAAPITAIVLAAVLSISVVYTLWQWFLDVKLTKQKVVATELPTNDKTANLITSIPDEHLFGRSLTKMPISSLGLRLTGIIKLDDPASSKALISMSGQPSKIYQVGDTLPLGVKIYAITQDTVVLENDDHLEQLPLPREPLQFRAANSITTQSHATEIAEAESHKIQNNRSLDLRHDKPHEEEGDNDE